jgi:type II secretory pathway predicted ATPase ExeA
VPAVKSLDLALVLSFYGLRAKPFQPTSDPTFLWRGRAQSEILSHLTSGILGNAGLLVLTGDVGTGKTMLTNALIEDLNDRVLVIRVVYPNLDPLEFLKIMAKAWGLDEPTGHREEFLYRLEQFLKTVPAWGKHALLVIDEAQSLSRELFPEIRQLAQIGTDRSNRLNILLVGQNELNTILSDPENVALSKQIKIRGTTSSLGHEVRQYVEHRLRIAGADRRLFTPGAIREMAAFSQGVPRLINVIGDLALITGYRRGAATINAVIVRECAGRLRPYRNGEPDGRRPEAVSVPTGEEDKHAGPPPRTDAALDGHRGALTLQPPGVRFIPSAEEDERAGAASRIARYGALISLLLVVAGDVDHVGRSIDERPDVTPSESREALTPRESSEAWRRAGQSDPVMESVVQPAQPSELDTEAMRMRQRPVDRLPAAPAITSVRVAPTRITADEPQEAPERVPDPASARRGVPDGRQGAGGRTARPAAPDQGARVTPRPRAAGGPPAERTESLDPGGIIDWLLNEYPARRQ